MTLIEMAKKVLTRNFAKFYYGQLSQSRTTAIIYIIIDVCRTGSVEAEEPFRFDPFDPSPPDSFVANISSIQGKKVVILNVGCQCPTTTMIPASHWPITIW